MKRAEPCWKPDDFPPRPRRRSRLDDAVAVIVAGVLLALIGIGMRGGG
jgi:hypothetical protein